MLTGAGSPIAESTRPVWHPVLEVLRWVSPLGWTVLAVGLCRGGSPAPLRLGRAADGRRGVPACSSLRLPRAGRRAGEGAHPGRRRPARVTVGDPATGRIEVTNTARRGLLPLLVELPVGDTGGPVRAAAADARAAPTRSCSSCRPAAAASCRSGRPRTVHGDPLGLVRRTVAWTERTELFVHPRTVALESLGAGLLRDLEGR